MRKDMSPGGNRKRKTQREKVKLPGFAPRLSENHIEYESSPELGGSNEEVYGGILGLSEETMAELRHLPTIFCAKWQNFV